MSRWNPETLEKKFADRFVVSPDGCWLWTGPLDAYGYGRVWHVDMKVRAHRASYLIHIGPIPEGMVICHRCDVKRCVNPAHLFLGTHADNVADKTAKGRGTFGTRNGMAKINERDARTIRAERGRTTQLALAQRFGISRRAIRFIQQGVTWSHLGPQESGNLTKPARSGR